MWVEPVPRKLRRLDIDAILRDVDESRGRRRTWNACANRDFPEVLAITDPFCLLDSRYLAEFLKSSQRGLHFNDILTTHSFSQRIVLWPSFLRAGSPSTGDTNGQNQMVTCRMNSVMVLWKLTEYRGAAAQLSAQLVSIGGHQLTLQTKNPDEVLSSRPPSG